MNIAKILSIYHSHQQCLMVAWSVLNSDMLELEGALKIIWFHSLQYE